MARVTLKPNPTENNEKQTDTAEADTIPPSSPPKESESAANTEESPLIGPLKIRGLPKAKEADGKKRKPRRKGRCMIATDTPEKNEIDKRQEETRQKKKSAEERKKEREEKVSDKKNKKNNKVKKALQFESEESEEADDVSDEVSDENVIIKKTKPNNDSPTSNINEGDYVLVEFKAGKESPVYYVGKILSSKDLDGDLQISYYRKKVSKNNLVSFTLPPIPDLKSVNISDVKVLLPKPTSAAVTRRQQDIVSFDFDFTRFKLC